MAQTPRGEPFSVPDPLADAWDAAMRLNGRLQARNDPLGRAVRGANRLARQGADAVSEVLRRAEIPNPQWQQLRTSQVRGETPRQRAQTASAVRPTATPAQTAPASLPKLRGPIHESDWRAAGVNQQPATGTYLADLSHPEKNPFMTTCADADCRHSYIDPFPASNLGRRYDLDEVRAGLADLRAGRPVDTGPHVTFINDNPHNPSPNQPLTTPTARMVAASILQSGAHDVNINSTTGGPHVRKPGRVSRHFTQRAVDINRIDGQRVSPRSPAKMLQDVALLQPNIAEDYGPSYLLNDKQHGRQPVRDLGTIIAHKTHLHLAGDR